VKGCNPTLPHRSSDATVLSIVVGEDRCRYAAIEAVKLGYGGQVYTRQLFGCHHETLVLGLAELEDETTLEQERVCKSGGGRKSVYYLSDGMGSVIGLADQTGRVQRSLLMIHLVGPLPRSVVGKWDGNLSLPSAGL
jgi:hypothetical protein